MKQTLKYILLIITVFSFGKLFSQSTIITQFAQADSICNGTAGVVRLEMYANNTAQEVSHFRLMFEYDATMMKIDTISTDVTFFTENLNISYPAPGQCVIIDTLSNPTNFYDTDTTKIDLAFDIHFNGISTGIGFVAFMSDSCYFKTETDEDIAGVYHDSIKIRVHPGRINYTLEQTGKGCSYETKGMAEVKVTAGASPYSYFWNQGMQNTFYPHQVGQLPEGETELRIIDANGCVYDTTIMIETLRAPNFDLTYETYYTKEEEFAVKEHPIRFYVKDLDDGYNWEWKIYYTDTESNIRDSLDWREFNNQTDFTYIFQIDNDYEIQLSAQSLTTGCDTTVIKTIVVEPAQLEFKNLVTPGSNRFKIKANGDLSLRDVFVSHVLIIQDRQGRRVYETKDFPDDGWNGGGCPNGTYYFILKAKSTRKEYKYQGTVVILGGY
jgi:hypothetical protein